MFDTEKFIGEIEKRPAIYDVRSKVYSNRVAKLRYWHEVGKEMYKGWDSLDQLEKRSLVKELQIKWKSIRDHFMRQLKQNINGEGPKKKKYVHFDQLQFLTANLGVKRPRNLQKVIKQEAEDSKDQNFPEDRFYPRVSILRPSSLDSQNDVLEFGSRDLSLHQELHGDRMGNKMFLLSLLPTMERLPHYSNIRVRLQLMEVLQAAVTQQDVQEQQFGYGFSDPHETASETD